MGCYVYPLNEVSAGAKAEGSGRVAAGPPAVAFHGILRLHSLFSAELLLRREITDLFTKKLGTHKELLKCEI